MKRGPQTTTEKDQNENWKSGCRTALEGLAGRPATRNRGQGTEKSAGHNSRGESRQSRQGRARRRKREKTMRSGAWVEQEARISSEKRDKPEAPQHKGQGWRPRPVAREDTRPADDGAGNRGTDRDARDSRPAAEGAGTPVSPIASAWCRGFHTEMLT